MSGASDTDLKLKRLAQYWWRADLMHRHLLRLKEVGRKKINDGDEWGLENQWELETYLSYWLSGLHAVVEGFEKLKLTNRRDVRERFEPRLKALRRLRNETYHFDDGTKGLLDDGTKVFQKMLDNSDWCEKLHTAIGDFIHGAQAGD